MKKLSTLRFILLTLIISCALESCNSRKIGFFNTNTPQYSVKEKNTDTNTPEMVAASSNSNFQNIPAAGNTINPQEVNITKKTGTKSSAAHPATSIPLSPKKANKEERKEIKKFIKENFKDTKKSATEINTLLLVIIAILLPPVAVALVDGITTPFWISIVLTLLFYLPGLIYALYRIFRKQ